MKLRSSPLTISTTRNWPEKCRFLLRVPSLTSWRSWLQRQQKTLLQSGKNIVFPSWFPGQWFGLFLRKDSPWTLGSPRALGLKSGYWFPFGPCPTVGLKSVISFCILDCKANTFSLQNVQTLLRHLKQKGTWSVCSCLLADPSSQKEPVKLENILSNAFFI